MSESSLTDAYAERLKNRLVWWKRLLDVQAPYRWNLRRLKPGNMLDVGCGLGRNLEHVRGHGVGVDPNLACLDAARASGFTVYTPEEFAASPQAKARVFDSILIAHVMEHMDFVEALALLKANLAYLNPGGQVILITPQERGYALDDTHVHFMDEAELKRLCDLAGLTVTRAYSYPFPRWAGRLFPYNEFVVTARSAG